MFAGNLCLASLFHCVEDSELDVHAGCNTPEDWHLENLTVSKVRTVSCGMCIQMLHLHLINVHYAVLAPKSKGLLQQTSDRGISSPHPPHRFFEQSTWVLDVNCKQVVPCLLEQSGHQRSANLMSRRLTPIRHLAFPLQVPSALRE